MAEIKKIKPDTYITAQHLNKNIKVMGLEGFQVLVVFIVLIISFFISIILPVLILIGLSIILTKITQELKKGNPTPVDSYFLKDKTKKTLIDESNVLQIISNNGKQNI